ncbi:hypothetical protein B0H19DRAFT_1065529 [Mycena capillaripes]|nr:hypothetical protein B0H19DRAFT_1065529 [Mycena capillaripes]
MPSQHTTIAATSQPYIRHTEPKPRAPLTAEQKSEKREAREKKQEEIDEAVSAWFTSTYAKATELAERFKRDQRYFLDIFFQGGARMVNHQEEINPYNAFKSIKAAECRENGEFLNAAAIHRRYYDEYTKLTAEEKQAYVDKFAEERSQDLKLRRDTPRGRLQDLKNTARNVESLMAGLRTRVGAEGFFCIVRNNPDFNVKPQWYFTSAEVESYMKIACRPKWDTYTVGTKLEAFAVAGCDPLNLLRTSKQKADFLKREIRDLLRQNLVGITGDENAEMEYVRYEEKIVHSRGVKLVGWTAPHFVNPSELSTSLPPLQELHHAIKTGTCCFVKLTPQERQERIENYNEEIAAGTRQPLLNQRNANVADGKKRRRERAATGGVREEDRINDENDSGDGGNSDGEADSAPPGKRRNMATDKEPVEVVPLPPKKRATTKKTTQPRKMTARQASNKKPAAKAAKAAPKKAAATRMRDDEVTRAVIQKRRMAAKKSRRVISDGEDDDVDGAAPAANITSSTTAPTNAANATPTATEITAANTVPTIPAGGGVGADSPASTG